MDKHEQQCYSFAVSFDNVGSKPASEQFVWLKLSYVLLSLFVLFLNDDLQVVDLISRTGAGEWEPAQGSRFASNSICEFRPVTHFTLQLHR